MTIKKLSKIVCVSTSTAVLAGMTLVSSVFLTNWSLFTTVPSAFAVESVTTPESNIYPLRFLDFEDGRNPGVSVGKVQSEVSQTSVHSGKYGLKIEFTGTTDVSGEQYWSAPSTFAGISIRKKLSDIKGISFWLRVDKPQKETKLVVTFAGERYQTKYQQDIPLDFEGWKKIDLYFKDIYDDSVFGDDFFYYHNMCWLYWEIRGSNSVVLHLDDVNFLVSSNLQNRERFWSVPKHNNPSEYYIFNSRLQILVGKSAGPFIHKVTAFRQKLIDSSTLVVNKTIINEEVLTANNGKIKVGDQEFLIRGTVTEGGLSPRVSLRSTPEIPLTYRFVLNTDTYDKEGFSIDGKTGSFETKPGTLITEVENPKEIVIGSLSKCRLRIEIAQATKVTIRRGDSNQIWLELTDNTGFIEFAISPPIESLEMALFTDRFKNVFNMNDCGQMEIRVLLSNTTDHDRAFSFNARMIDFEGNEVFNKKNTGRVIAEGVTDYTLRPNITRLGFYKLIVETKDEATGEQFRRFITLGVIQPVQRLNPPDQSGKFGVHFFARTRETAELINRVGITWTREDIYHKFMEPEPGKYNWGGLDLWTANARRAGLWVMPVSGEWAPWINTGEIVSDKWFKSKKVDLEAWGKWWSEMAHRYKGKVSAWEVANEGFYGLPVPLNVDLHQTAYKSIKAQDPDVPVVANVTGGMVDGGMVDYLKEFLAAGGNKGCDVVSAHPYTQNFSASPEQGSMREMGERVSKIIAPYFNNPRLWWTEYAFFGEDEYNPDIPCNWESYILSERAQAQYIVRAYLAGMAAGVEHMFYFLHQDSEKSPWQSGLLREEGIRPAICAINTICHVLEYTGFVQDIRLKDDVQIMVFKGKEYSAASVWCTASPEHKYVLHVPLAAADVEVLEFMGNTVQFPEDAREIAIPFDGSPAYITSRKMSPEQLAQVLSNARIEGGVSVSVGRIFLKPGQLEVELHSETSKTTEGQVKVLEPAPQDWGLKTFTDRFSSVAPGSSTRVKLTRENSLPTEGDPALLRLHVSDTQLIERSYNFIFAKYTNEHITVDAEPINWGEPTMVLDSSAYTSSRIDGVRTPSTVWYGPGDLSAKIWLRWDEANLYIAIEASDDVQRQAAGSPMSMWMGDSVQYGFDAAGNAPNMGPDGWDVTDDSEWLIGLYQDKPMLVRSTAPRGADAGPVPGVTYSVRRAGNITTYVAAFPWNIITPAAGETGSIFGFNFIVNDDDGDGRKGWLGMTLGMGESKAPRLFRKVLLIR